MVDEDTKQLLRDILATQREQLALYQHVAEDQKAQLSIYTANSSLYRESLSEWQLKERASRWATVIRAVTLAGVVFLIGYVVLFGLHAR